MKAATFTMTAVLIFFASACDVEPTDRVALVLDPTVLTDDSVNFERRVVEPLIQTLMNLPPRTRLDLFLVRQEGHLNGGADHRDSVLFDPYQAVDLDSARRLVATRFAERARTEWRTARAQPTTRASCILSALHRAGAVTPRDPDERAVLLVVSDFREVCRDFRIVVNMEAEVPDSFPAGIARGDLSAFDTAYMVLTDGLTNRTAETDHRLYTLWSNLALNWGIRSRPARQFEIPLHVAD